MEDIRNKIKKKKLEEIELEKKFLHDLKSKFETKKKEYLEQQKEKDLMIDEKNEIINGIENKGDIDINEVILKIEQEIQDNSENISDTNRMFELKKDIINKDLHELDSFSEKLEDKEKELNKTVNLKNKKVEGYTIRLKEINTQYNNLNNVIKNINIREKEYKKKINDMSLKSVIERHNLIQETTFNLNQKKRFIKEEKKLKETLKELELDNSKILNLRKELRLKMENEYLESLDGENAVELIENRENTFAEFDKETKKIIFFSKNKIEVIKNKLKMGNDFFNLNQERKIKERQEEYKEINFNLKQFSKERKKYEIEINELKNDVSFIQNSINTQNLETTEYYEIKKEDIKKRTKEILTKKTILNNQLKDEFDLMTKNISNLQSKNSLLNKKINKVKECYYRDKRNNEERKNNIKINCKKINLEKKKLQLEFGEYKKEYQSDKENIIERINYLERKM